MTGWAETWGQNMQVFINFECHSASHSTAGGRPHFSREPAALSGSPPLIASPMKP